MKKHFLYFVFPAMLFVAGCKDEAEQIPAYLRLEPFVVNEQGGAAWHKITDGWLYVNGELLGAYTLPATVPVLAEGESEVILFPGIKENGIVFTPNIYPFLTRYETTVNLAPPGITTIQPNTEYDADAVFPWSGRGDLDGSSTLQFENRDGDNATGFSISAEGAFADESLRMEVDTAHDLMEIATEKVLGLPVTGERQVWLEMHYNNDMPFVLFLISSSSGAAEFPQVVYQFNPTESWNKIYLNLTEFITSTAKEEYRLLFYVKLPEDEAGKFTQLDGTVLVDNIRLVHF